MTPDLGRRAFLHASGAIGLLALLPDCGGSPPSSALGSGRDGRFLNAHELETLRAVTARFIPGPPDDPDPGALEAGVAEAIDRLLAIFEFSVPPIHGGGPFSDRGGAAHDDFADFVPLDVYTELGWRIRIEGSKGLPEREFAGPVLGLQEIYRRGLAHLDARSLELHAVEFIAAPPEHQDAILADLGEGELRTFVGTALANTMDAMYGPPEYGGNRDRVGWNYTHWDGDTQPRGYSDEEVSGPGGEPKLTSSSLARLAEKFLGGLVAQAAPRGASSFGGRDAAKT